MKFAKTGAYVVMIFLFFSTCGFFGCLPVEYYPEPEISTAKKPIIGEIISIRGENVTVADKKAVVNMYVHENEEVSTGPGSEVTIRFDEGGILHLYENTDPIFEIIQTPFCYLIQMFKGHAFLDTEGTCFKAETDDGSVTADSKIDIRIEEGRTIYRVLEGRINVVARNKPQVIKAVLTGQSAAVSKARVLTPRKMAEPELRELRLQFNKIRLIPVKKKDDIRIRKDRPEIRAGINLPRLKGRSMVDARSELKRLGLRWRINEVQSGKVRPGTVVQQYPRAGAKVKDGATVTLDVETDTIKLPSFKGRSIGNARSELKGLGLRWRIKEVRSGKFRPGRVVKQYPRAGTQVKPATTVSLDVETDTIKLPSFNGRSMVDARSELKRLGLRWRIKEVRSGKVRPGRVVKQYPRAGTQVKPGTTVNLDVEASDIKTKPVKKLPSIKEPLMREPQPELK